MLNAFTVGRSNVVHASRDLDPKVANMLCGAESHRGPRRHVSRAFGQLATCKTCLRIIESQNAPAAPEPISGSQAPEPYAAPIGPQTAFQAVLSESLAATARAFG